MLFLLIPFAWLTLIGLVTVLCCAASRGDREPVDVIQDRGGALTVGLGVYGHSSAPVSGRCPSQRPALRARPSRGRRFAHGIQ